MRIAEIFKSTQGEGLLTGTAASFVRTSGCNLRCAFCDTPYASWQPEGDDLPVREIAKEVLSHKLQHTVITGGEPMLFAELIPLCERLKQLGYHITIETAGTLFLPLECDLMSISPKLSNSTPVHGIDAHGIDAQWRRRHEQSRHVPEVIHRLVDQYEYQIKFVVGRPDDLDEIDPYLAIFPEIDRDRVMLMPQGTDPDALSEITAWLEPYCQQAGLRFCPRMQVQWYGLVRGT